MSALSLTDKVAFVKAAGGWGVDFYIGELKG